MVSQAGRASGLVDAQARELLRQDWWSGTPTDPQAGTLQLALDILSYYGDRITLATHW